MNNLAGLHAAGNPQNVGTPNNNQASGSAEQYRRKLDTYIYDYFLRNGQFKLAKALYNEVDLEVQEKASPDRKGANGLSPENDTKDDIPGRPADLPRPNLPSEVNSAFLFDWWCQFWDCWQAARSKNNSQTKAYLQNIQNQRVNMDRQRMALNNPQMQALNARAGMMSNGMAMSAEMRKAMMQQGGRPVNPAQYQQMQRQQQAAALAQQGQMQREGQQLDINGQPRPQTPGSGEAPSPKRQRLESGNFNGQAMAGARGNMAGVSGQPNVMQMQNAQQKSNVLQYSSGLRQHMQSAIDGKNQDTMQLPNGVNQGSPALMSAGDPVDPNGIRQMNGNGPAHALQDYQMQLMLLEQQNKKRLLMARQEQEGQGGTGPVNGQNGGPGNGPSGPNGQFSAPNMSPSNSRTGPSPNPDEQMKRETPKMAPSGIPQSGMDMGMQGRASPVPGFDPSQMNPGMVPAFPQGMKMHAGMMGPNGQHMTAAGHPAFAQQNPQMNNISQHMEMMRMQQASKAGGVWPQGPHGGMMHQVQAQAAPNMTPQQRNSTMPPPPAPPTGDNQNRTQPPSPQQNAAPPTPSQANKPNPKKKNDAKQTKKAANKKGGVTAATPASEAGEQPPTPTPAPPITPTAPPQQFKNNQGPVANGQPQMAQPGGMSDVTAGMDMAAGPFGHGLDDMDMNFSMDFASLGTDNVLAMDFGQFLPADSEVDAFDFDSAINFDGGLEAGGDL